MKTMQDVADLRSALQGCWDARAPQSFDPAAPRVRLHEAGYDAEEIWAALDCLLSTQVTMGDKVRKFEDEFARRFGFAHAIMVNSGSSANLMAAAAVTNPATSERLRPGDEVIVPALAWSTTVWPLIQNGLVPVVVDIDPETLNIDPDEVERAIGPRTRGLMPVHVYGNPCDMTALMGIVRERSLTLIEDCCEALGARYGKRSVGSFGNIGTFSFYYSHHITTIEGGMCVTDDPDLAELLRILRAHGWVRETRNPDRHWRAHPRIHPRFLFVNVGYNLRPTELQGAIGSVQLPKLDGFVAIRSANAAWWREQFRPWRGVLDLQKETPGGTSSWFGFPMSVREGSRIDKEKLASHLESRGVETRPIICGNIAAQPGLRAYPHRVVGDLAKADHVMKSGFTFGNHQKVDERAREYVARCVREVLVR